MITTLQDKKHRITNNDFAVEGLDFCPDALADELIGELNLDSGVEETQTMTISVGPSNSDLFNEEEINIEKIARFKRMIARGEYRINHGAIAEAMMASGDLNI